ncbi:hypothetical protein PS15p_201995 [Mucor circinelloides]
MEPNLLEVLLSNMYEETNKSKSAKLSMMLVPFKILQFARLFYLKFTPTDSACIPFVKERLPLLVCDIQDIIALSEDPGLTIPALLS